ncbi:hypothetical protein GGH91_004411 [Coemansia sp. RSA 2671]|nr:hypothetical protein GGH91_004411 [Coemansia sp. RSA 2671]
MREIVVSSSELCMIEVVVNPIAPLQHIVFLGPSALLLHANVVPLGLLSRCDNSVNPGALLTCDNVIRPGAFLLGDSASRSAVLLHRDNAASPVLARHRDKAISTAVLPQRNIIDSPGAPLLRDLTVSPSLLLQRCIATSLGVQQLPIVIAGTDELQQVDDEAETAHVETAVTRRVLRLAPSLAADSDMPTSARTHAPSAPSDYAADRNSIIVLRPVRRRAFSARSIPMSQLMDFTSNTAPRRRLSQQASVGTTPALCHRNTTPSLPPRIGAKSAPSSPAQAPLSVANERAPMLLLPARVISPEDVQTAAAEAADSSPELETITEEEDGVAALGDACNKAFGSTGAINTDFGPFQQASSSSLAPANVTPLNRQELNDTSVTGGLGSRWLDDEWSPQTLSQYVDSEASTAHSVYSYSSSASSSMQSLWTEVDPSAEWTSTLFELTAADQQSSTSSLADTASSVSPRKRDKLLGRSPSTFSLRSALGPSSDQAGDSGIERVSTPGKLSLSGALKSPKHKASGEFGLNSSGSMTPTPRALRRAPSLSLKALMHRPRSEATAPLAD